MKRDKLLGSIVGMAIGDALGMPTEFLTPEQIREHYGAVRELRAPYQGHFHHGALAKGQITDDTEQMLAIMESYSTHRTFSASLAAQALINWATTRNAFESTYLGPSSRRALERLMEGEPPEQTGDKGTTVGGAMRVLAVAAAFADRPTKAIEAAAAVSLPTHGTSCAISGATSMVSALVAAFSDTASLEDIQLAAKWGADQGVTYGVPYPSPSISKRIDWAIEIADEFQHSPMQAAAELYDCVGTGMVAHEIVPTIIGLLSVRTSEPMELIIAAANMGGDTDTVAALLGSILGAWRGVSMFPVSIVQEISAVNGLSFDAIVDRFLKR